MDESEDEYKKNLADIIVGTVLIVAYLLLVKEPKQSIVSNVFFIVRDAGAVLIVCFIVVEAILSKILKNGFLLSDCFIENVKFIIPYIFTLWFIGHYGNGQIMEIYSKPATYGYAILLQVVVFPYVVFYFFGVLFGSLLKYLVEDYSENEIENAAAMWICEFLQEILDLTSEKEISLLGSVWIAPSGKYYQIDSVDEIKGCATLLRIKKSSEDVIQEQVATTSTWKLTEPSVSDVVASAIENSQKKRSQIRLRS